MERYIKFYGPRDMATGHECLRARTLLQKLNSSKQRFTINEILQLFNIVKLIDNGAFPDNWTGTEINEFKNEKGRLLRIISSYSKNITSRNFSKRMKDVAPVYSTDAIEWFISNKIGSRVSGKQLMNAVDRNNISIRSLLAVEGIAKDYPHLLRQKILEHSKAAEILVDKYLVRRDNARGPFICQNRYQNRIRLPLSTST